MGKNIYKNLKCNHPMCETKAAYVFTATIKDEEPLGFCKRHKEFYSEEDIGGPDALTKVQQ